MQYILFYKRTKLHLHCLFGYLIKSVTGSDNFVHLKKNKKKERTETDLHCLTVNRMFCSPEYCNVAINLAMLIGKWMITAKDEIFVSRQ
jgi:hypothetical protein